MVKPQPAGFDWAFYFFWIIAGTVGWLLGVFFPGSTALLMAGLALAFLQWLVLERRLPKSNGWIVHTLAGWIAGWLLITLLGLDPVSFFSGLALGFLTGVSQWWFLRRRIDLAGWWIVVSIVAWTTGLGLLPGLFNSGMIPAVISGLALELLLRFPKEMPEADRRVDAG